MSDQSSCFCDDPTEARDRFLAECLKAGLSPLSLPARTEMAGGLFCDAVKLGAPSAHSTIVLCSGAAGFSGMVNAGICAGLLNNRIQRHLERQVAIVLVHAVNPLGPIWPKPPAAATPVLVDGDAISKAEASWTRELLSAVDRRFGTEMGATLNDEDGTGDAKPAGAKTPSAWTRQDLKRIAGEFLTDTQFVLAMDFRTGLGPWAVPTLRNPDPPASAARGRARRWFGPLDGEETKASDQLGAADQAGSGGLAGYAADAETVSMIVDFGTFPGTGLVSTVTGRQQTNQVYPAQRDWREKVFAQADAIIMRAIEAAEEMANAGQRLKSAEQDEF
ncbi:DUF2817 domain-containing protein [Hwanghaeella grinnelliae]|uniref:DUF2817 domain-containing protein n=1 Tax=Hwanghaeella grinnelliae TaxID=2500179 RepID=UPI001386CAF0|nr:DUF2817 domain-containing protein [Hwanghaeella grinnelliae]